MGEDLCYTTALELVGLYESKRVSPVEVARAILERIERLNPILNCYCYCNRDDVLAAARQSEARWSLGELAGAGSTAFPSQSRICCSPRGGRRAAAPA